MRYVILAAGILLPPAAVWLRARRKLTVNLTAFWGITGIFLIIAGAVSPVFHRIITIFSSGKLLPFIIGIVILAAAFWISLRFSHLSIKNQEMAVQLSLLLQERTQMLAEMDKIDEKNFVCNQYDGKSRKRLFWNF